MTPNAPLLSWLGTFCCSFEFFLPFRASLFVSPPPRSAPDKGHSDSQADKHHSEKSSTLAPALWVDRPSAFSALDPPFPLLHPLFLPPSAPHIFASRFDHALASCTWPPVGSPPTSSLGARSLPRCLSARPPSGFVGVVGFLDESSPPFFTKIRSLFVFCPSASEFPFSLYFFCLFYMCVSPALRFLQGDRSPSANSHRAPPSPSFVSVRKRFLLPARAHVGIAPPDSFHGAKTRISLFFPLLP